LPAQAVTKKCLLFNSPKLRYDKATPHDSAREDYEENLRQKKAEKRRNPLWISSFDNAFLAEICRKTPQP
jgi:hypothetical protein